MSEETKLPTLPARLWKSIGPNPLPEDDRGRMRMVVDNLVLHLHPAKVPATSQLPNLDWRVAAIIGILVLVSLIIIVGAADRLRRLPA